jgi:hypothetical protein
VAPVLRYSEVRIHWRHRHGIVRSPLKNEELVAERKDLGVTGVARSEYPSESVENKSNQSREQGPER